MSRINQLWQSHVISKNQQFELCFGQLHLWVRREAQQWQIAYENELEAAEERFSLSFSEQAMPETQSPTRWILDEQVESFRLRPLLPDRPLIVRPESPVCLMPEQTVRFFIDIPLWLELSFGGKAAKGLEIPSLRLSNSWFGTPTSGELCYAMKTPARLHQQDLEPSVQRAVFPLEVMNRSTETLNFERLCIRPQHLSIYEGKTSLWTNRGRASYRGADTWSRVAYAAGLPGFDGVKRRVGRAREKTRRGGIQKTFDSFKKKAEL